MGWFSRTAFRDRTLKNKLSLVTLATTGCALILALLAILAAETVGSWYELVNQHSITARSVARNVRSAVVFDDEDYAQESLEVLALQPSLRAAVLYREDGSVLASFPAGDAAPQDLPPMPTEEGHRLDDGTLIISAPIVFEGKAIGSLSMRVGLESFVTRLGWFGVIALVLSLLSVLIVYPLWSSLQHVISEPIQSLLGTVKQVSEKNDYSLRAQRTGKDEIGQLIDGFNEMLVQIQARDSALAKHSSQLEDQVKARTGQLTRVNQTLEQQISERRVVETQLADFKATLDQTMDDVFMFDPGDLTIFYTNRGATEHTGFSEAELREKRFVDLLPEYTDEAFRALLSILMSKPPGFLSIESRVLQKEGLHLPVSIFLQFVKPAEAKGRFLAIMRDISQQKDFEWALKEARDDAEAANRAKSQFLANMSHEIRTPMNAVLGFTQLALAGDLPPQTRDYLTKILSSGKSLLGIMNDILDFSKIEAEKLGIESIEFDLAELVEDICHMFAPKAEQKGLELICRLPADCPASVVGDPLRVRQVLANLLGNAVKFTAQGEVELSVAFRERVDEDSVLIFRLRDTGIGLSPGQIEELFQPFSQADVSHTRKFGGTGLGLAITKRLVELQGGSISVAGEPGVGSVFEVTLPLARPAGASVQVEPDPRWQDRRILVYDDNLRAARVIVEILEQLGARASAATTLPEALAALGPDEASDLDAVLLDWSLASTDVQRLFDELPVRGNEPIPCVPMIGVTTGATPAEARQAARLIKPPTPRSLARVLNDLFVEAADGAAAPEPSSRGHDRDVLKGARVLLVEDEPVNQEVARGFLSAVGIEARVADNGRKALEAAAEGRFEVILMDVQMPEMDGYEATRRLRGMEITRDVPIVAMTADVMPETRRKCLDVGMNEFLGKPIDQEALYTVLSRLLESRSPEAGDQESPAADAEPAPPSPSPAAATSTSVPPARLPGSLSGADLAAGLHRFGGSEPFYCDMLTKFHDTYQGLERAVGQALDSGDHAQAIAKLHDLKGASGTLSLTAVSTAAARLESAVREGNPDPELVGALSRELGSTLSQLGAWIHGS